MSGPITSANGRIIQRNRNGNGHVPPAEALAALVKKMAPEMAKALPRHMNPERMARMVLTTLRANPKLGNCSQGSFLGSIMTAAQLGLEVGPLGHVYLVPYKGNCQLILGYQGMIELARRSGIVTNIYACVVREGDRFKYRLGLYRDIEHEPSEDQDRETKPITYAYAVAHYKDGPPDFAVLSRFEIAKRRDRSAAANSGPWVTDEEAMTLKTAVRALWKWLPKSTEMARAAVIEDVSELGESQSSGWDPDVTSALEKQGLPLGGSVDSKTGELPGDEGSQTSDVRGEESLPSEKGNLQVA